MNPYVIFSSPFKGEVGRGMGLKMRDSFSLYYPIPTPALPLKERESAFMRLPCRKEGDKLSPSLMDF